MLAGIVQPFLLSFHVGFSSKEGKTEVLRGVAFKIRGTLGI